MPLKYHAEIRLLDAAPSRTLWRAVTAGVLCPSAGATSSSGTPRERFREANEWRVSVDTWGHHLDAFDVRAPFPVEGGDAFHEQSSRLLAQQGRPVVREADR
jgi:hypothetical protein